VGVQPSVRVCRVQSRRLRRHSWAGWPRAHIASLLAVWVHGSWQLRRRGVRVLEVRVWKPRGLQRGEEHRLAVSPSQPNWRRWRRTLGRV